MTNSNSVISYYKLTFFWEALEFFSAQPEQRFDGYIGIDESKVNFLILREEYLK